MALALCGKSILKSRLAIFTSLRHSGYVVLYVPTKDGFPLTADHFHCRVPEIGEDLPGKNPLLHHDGLPEFSNITIENCMSAVAKQTLEFEAGVKEIEQNIEKLNTKLNVFKDVLEPLEHLGAPLDTTWGLSKTLYLGNSTLMPTKSYLAIHDRAKRARAAKFNSPAIYECCKNELDREHTDEDKRILNKFVLEGKLNGLELEDSEKRQLEEYLTKLTIEREHFRRKIDISTKQFSHLIEDASIVRDFPQELLQSTTTNSSNPLKGPWKITLHPNVAMATMENCPEREIRWNIWQALVARGSGFGNRELSTGLNLEEIRYARRDIATILGFKTYADMSMETKMAGSVENVNSMLRKLLERAKPAQERELEELYAFALERGFKGDRIELWDVPYWKRKQQRSLYEYDEERIKEYFPLPKVLEGLFQLCEKLFNIVIKQRSNISTWHKDVKFYDVFEAHSSAPIAGFYVDPYAPSRDKISGWMVGIQNQSRITETRPLAALVFNFDQPEGNKPSLLDFAQIKSLFHRFGLALQHLMTRTNYSEVSGSSNIEWDAVEVSGHVLCHWLFNDTTVKSISCHVDSGDTFPTQMFDNLVKVHRHLAGIELSRELYLSALDLELHHTKEYWLDVVKRLWPEFRSFPLDKIDSHPCSFTKIFTEEWGAAYYSHIWSRMIAADVYGAFHEVQGNEREILDVSKRYRDTFLALGGSCHPSQVFRKFRGRDPSPKALLSSLGLNKDTTTN